jgi:hypothetical protein
MANYVKKPGFMGRAIVAWVVLNVAMFVTLGVSVYFLGPFLNAWYVILPILLVTIVSEVMITGDTVYPVVRQWIDQEEYVKEGEKPSWQK